MSPITNPFEPTSEDTQLTPMSTKYSRLPSNLTLPKETMESISRTTTAAPTPSGELESPSSHPFSAFYSHPLSAVSSEQTRTSMAKDSRLSFDRDVEKGLACPVQKGLMTPQASARPSLEPSLTTTQTNTSLSTPMKITSSCGKDKSYVTVWPAGSEVRQRKKDARRMKGCVLFRNLTRKQKIIAKVLLAILVIGIATAIGCAISYKTGGLVWKSANNYGAIGS